MLGEYPSSVELCFCLAARPRLVVSGETFTGLVEARVRVGLSQSANIDTVCHKFAEAFRTTLAFLEVKALCCELCPETGANRARSVGFPTTLERSS